MLVPYPVDLERFSYIKGSDAQIDKSILVVFCEIEFIGELSS